ncbi:MAG: transcriptional repressor [Alphaproteobacteria bacterium]|nr:transcriptional repressor [Alphaproteobacteria bacterium]
MYRNTKQKMYVLEATKMLYHPTADSIYHYVRNHCPHVSKGTIYRCLTSLVATGQVLHIQMPNGADCYDSHCHNHYHLVCRQCGNVYDIDVPYMNQLNDTVVHGALIQEHTTLFHGVCPHCYQQGKKD